MRLFILGATGGTGRALVRQARRRGHHVTAFVRSPEKLGPLIEGVAVLRGDPLDVAELRAALPNHDAVLSALGPPGTGRTTVLREGARSIVAAMHAVGSHRILVVSAAVLFPDTGLLGAMLRRTVLRNVAEDAAEMERIVMASGLDWTIARPPRLTNGPLTEQYLVSDGQMPRGRRSVSRADVAHFLLDEVEERRHVHQIVGMAGVGRHSSPERHGPVQTHPLTNESGQHQV
jgi:putative NADH-flavin reductase